MAYRAIRARSGERLRGGLAAVVALSASGAAWGDLPNPFNPTLYGTNFFNWVDFDQEDAWVTQPTPISPDAPPSGLTGYAAQQVTHDDNVYRLPAPALTPVTSTPYSRSDTIDTVSAGVDGRFAVSRQSVEVLARVDDNLYFHNPHLNNVGQSLQGLGNWAVGRRWSGQVGASYDQWLAQFGNYVQLAPDFGLPKNMSSTRRLLASSQLWFGYHWVIRANGLQRSTSYSENRFDTFTGNTGGLGIEYYAAGGEVVGGSFSDTKGHYQLPAAHTRLKQWHRRMGKIKFENTTREKLRT